MTLTLQETAGVVTAVTVILGALVVVIRRIRPVWKSLRRDFIAGRDALVGREEIVHPETGRVVVPAVPGIGTRMANVEEAIVAIARHQADIADLKVNDARHDATLAKHAEDIAALKLAQVERIVSKAESTAAFQAMEAVARAQPDLDVDAVDADVEEDPAED